MNILMANVLSPTPIRMEGERYTCFGGTDFLYPRLMHFGDIALDYPRLMTILSYAIW